MSGTTIALDEPLWAELARVAAAQGTTVEALVRKTLEEKVAACSPRKRPLPTSLGSGASGHSDTSVLAGEMRPEPRSWR